MKDKRKRHKAFKTYDQELTFTKEDRNQVFERIENLEKSNPKKKSLASKKFAPITASLLVMGLCMLLFIPSILSGDFNNEDRESLASEAEFFTTLVTVKDDNERLPINLLLTYNKDKKMMKILSIPRDTYAPILDNERTIQYDKLSHAYVNGSGGAQDVRTAVSNLFDLTIDYYAVIDLETLSTLVDSVNGIVYDLQEDIRVRAISTVAFEFKKGTHRLSGEEVVALLMDATTGRNTGEEDQLNLIKAVINQALKVLPQSQLKQLTTNIEGNIPNEQLLENMEMPSIQMVSLKEGMIGSRIDEVYYIKFEKDFLNSISEELTTFN